MRTFALIAVLAAGCAPRPEPSATELAAERLTAREARTIEIRAIAEHQADGRRVICGVYGYPLEQAPKLSRRPFALVDGELVAQETAALQPLLAACRAKLP